MNPRPWSLYLLSFIMGVCGIGYEYTFSKISSDLMGQTVTQWAIIIGLMMLAMGMGADYQKKLSDRGLLEKFIIFEILLSLSGSFGAVFLVYVFGAFRNYFILVQYLISFGVGFLIGMEIPILARLNETVLKAKNNSSFSIEKQAIKFNLAQIFKMDYLGGFIGAVLWALVLIRLTHSILKIAFLLSLLNLLGLLITLWGGSYWKKLDPQPGRSSGKRTVLLGCLGLNFLLVALGFFSVKEWTPFLEQKLFRDRVVYSTTTPYQHLVITENKMGVISLYINGNLQFTNFDEKIYHEWLVHPSFLLSRSIEDVLILGGGDGLALREVLKYPQVKQVTLVELDPDMIDLAKNNFYLTELNQNSLNHPKVKIMNSFLTPTQKKKNLILPDLSHYPIRSSKENNFPPIEIKVYTFDAVKWVEKVQQTFDIIILDFPDPHSLELSQLYSLAFYRELNHLLRPGGVLVQQASSPVYTKESFLLTGRTLKKAGFRILPYQATVPSFGPWGWWLAQTDRGTDQLKTKWLKASRSIEAINTVNWPVKLEHLTPELMRGGIVFSPGGLLGKKRGYNTRLNHLAYRYYLESGEDFWW